MHATIDLFFSHLAPEPGTEPLAAVSISCSSNTPHECKDKPRLNQLLQPRQFLLGKRLLTLNNQAQKISLTMNKLKKSNHYNSKTFSDLSWDEGLKETVQ